MCVVAAAAEVDGDELFEIHELESKESLLLKVSALLPFGNQHFSNIFPPLF